MSELDDLKDRLATAAQILRWELADMWGHVSAKTPRGDTFVLLHLRPPVDRTLSENEILEYDFNGRLVDGRRDPPEEIFFYTCLYKAKADVGAVIHCHPPIAVSLIAGGKKIIPIHQHSLKFGKGVPMSPLALRYLGGGRRKGGQDHGRSLCSHDQRSWRVGNGRNDSGRLPQHGARGADGEDDRVGGKRGKDDSVSCGGGEEISIVGSGKSATTWNTAAASSGMELL